MQNSKMKKCMLYDISFQISTTEAILSVCLMYDADSSECIFAVIFHILSCNNHMFLTTPIHVHFSNCTDTIDRLHLVHFNLKLRSSVTKCIFDLFPISRTSNILPSFKSIQNLFLWMRAKATMRFISMRLLFWKKKKNIRTTHIWLIWTAYSRNQFQTVMVSRESHYAMILLDLIYGVCCFANEFCIHNLWITNRNPTKYATKLFMFHFHRYTCDYLEFLPFKSVEYVCASFFVIMFSLKSKVILHQKYFSHSGDTFF